MYPKRLHRYGTGKAPECRKTIRGALAKLHRKCSGATDWETGESASAPAARWRVGYSDSRS